ncbi:hypothetical protein [Kitasatospora viridis]|uniref:hypothetical protein n=1 Tax=Kitasatospora viridis TaxID=281105 RepID=UPI0011A4878C|nr:hypothetical protein [Kitasatospora viridis]
MREVTGEDRLVGRMRRAALVIGIVSAVVLTGCTNRGGSNESVSAQPSIASGVTVPSVAATASASGSSSWTGTPPPPEALAAYNAMMQDIVALAATSDYKNPRLASHMIGQPLAQWTKTLANQQLDGVVSHGVPSWNPRVTKVSPPDRPDRVEVSDCLDGANWLRYKLDGELADHIPSGKHVSAAAITLQPDGRWMVTEQLIGAEGTC